MGANDYNGGTRTVTAVRTAVAYNKGLALRTKPVSEGADRDIKSLASMKTALLEAPRRP